MCFKQAREGLRWTLTFEIVTIYIWERINLAPVWSINWIGMLEVCRNNTDGREESNKWILKVKVTQSCPTLCNSMDYTVHGILQARILKWVDFPFSRGSKIACNINWSYMTCPVILFLCLHPLQYLYPLCYPESRPDLCSDSSGFCPYVVYMIKLVCIF